MYISIQKNINEESIFFIHGFSGDHSTWDETRDKLNCSSIAIDIPGHSNSKFNNLDDIYDFNDWTKEMYLTLYRLGIKKINLCGYSMGGRLALNFASKYPNFINKLIIESTSLGIDDYLSRIKRKEEDELLSENIKSSLK